MPCKYKTQRLFAVAQQCEDDALLQVLDQTISLAPLIQHHNQSAVGTRVGVEMDVGDEAMQMDLYRSREVGGALYQLN